MKFSIILPNYNGIELLKRYYSSIYGFAKTHNINEIIVVDDSSRDNSVSFIQTNFPDTRILINDKNMGFGETCNRGVRASRGDYIFLFNTDIEGMDEERAANLIMTARAPWFAEETTSEEQQG